jgi:hypothetical protein
MILTQDELKRQLSYDPETGALTRRIRSSNRIKIGDEAGTASPDGYRRVWVGGKLYLAHRLAWLYVHGAWPTGELDHIDGQKANNRLANLRDVPHQMNVQNLKIARKDSKSGVLGVHWEPSKHRYVAQSSLNGKRTFLGHFKTISEAEKVVVEFKQQNHPGFIA